MFIIIAILDNGTKETETCCQINTQTLSKADRGPQNLGVSLQSSTSGEDEPFLPLGWKTYNDAINMIVTNTITIDIIIIITITIIIRMATI